MRYYVDVEDSSGRAQRVPIEEIAMFDLNRRGGGVSRSTVRRLLRKAQCCPPAVSEASLPIEPADDQILIVAGCNLTFADRYTFEILNDPVRHPGATLPTIIGVVSAFGDSEVADVFNVNIDATDTLGNFFLSITSDCGCQHIVAFLVQAE